MDDLNFRVIELEYQQASALFQRGFELVFGLVRGFLYGNALIAGAIGLSSSRQLVLVLSAAGAVGSGMALVLHVRLARVVRMWLARAKDLETEFGADLYTKTFLGEVFMRRQSPLAPVFYASFVFGWLALLFLKIPN